MSKPYVSLLGNSAGVHIELRPSATAPTESYLVDYNSGKDWFTGGPNSGGQAKYAKEWTTPIKYNVCFDGCRDSAELLV